MRAILIDPHIKSFTEIDFNNSSDILNLIDADHFDVATVTRYEKVYSKQIKNSLPYEIQKVFGDHIIQHLLGVRLCYFVLMNKEKQ